MSITRLGIYGGTFNPIHTGHLIIAQEMFEQFSLDRVVIIPSARPPHKTRKAVIAPEHRYAMVARAIETDPRFEVSDMEIRRPGLSYTIETLRALRADYGPDCRFFFIIGADSLVEIDTWRSPDAIFSESTIVVVPRPGVNPDRAPLPWRDMAVLTETPLTAISSTDIRRRTRDGRSIRYLVPDAVERYIREYGLYREEE